MDKEEYGGPHAKMAIEVWIEADEKSKDAVNAKIAEITEKWKEIGAYEPKQYLVLVITILFS
jgi:hypothetical protein